MKLNVFTKGNSNLSWLFLLLAIFFSPLRCYGLFTVGPFTGSLFKIFAFLMIVTAIVRYFDKIVCDVPFRIVVAILGMDLFALAQSSSLGLFPSYFVSHVVFLFGYIVIQNSSKNSLSLVKAYVYGSIIPGALGLFQWISVMRGRGVPDLPLQRFVTTVGKDDIFLYGNYRVVGTLQDPSYYGLFMASVFVLCVGLIISGNSQKNKLEKLAFISIMFMSLLCIFTSGSVSSMIAAATGLLLLLYNYRANFAAIAKYLVLMVVISTGVLLFMSVYFNYNPIDVLLFKLNHQGAENASAGALYGRGHFFESAINNFWESPIWGVGFGNMTRSSGHNSYLTILALQGIVGFMLHFCLLIFYPLMQYIRAKDLSKENYLLAISFAALMGMAIQIGGYDCLYKMDASVVVILLFYSSLKKKSNY